MLGDLPGTQLAQYQVSKKFLFALTLCWAAAGTSQLYLRIWANILCVATMDRLVALFSVMPKTALSSFAASLYCKLLSNLLCASTPISLLAFLLSSLSFLPDYLSQIAFHSEVLVYVFSKLNLILLLSLEHIKRSKESNSFTEGESEAEKLYYLPETTEGIKAKAWIKTQEFWLIVLLPMPFSVSHWYRKTMTILST